MKETGDTTQKCLWTNSFVFARHELQMRLVTHGPYMLGLDKAIPIVGVKNVGRFDGSYLFAIRNRLLMFIRN